MPGAGVSLPVLPPSGPLRLTPTDVSQFVRLEQCERYLRFRIADRAGQKFMEQYDVIPQRITPLLSLSGSTFESGIEADLGKRFRSVQFAAKYALDHNRPANNAEVVAEAWPGTWRASTTALPRAASCAPTAGTASRR